MTRALRTVLRRLRGSVSLPPHVLLRRAVAPLARKLAAARVRSRDRAESTYARQDEPPCVGRPLGRYLRPLGLRLTRDQVSDLAALAEDYLAHRFDLLGSGPVEVAHGSPSRGVARRRCGPTSPVEPDPAGRWLEARINPANLAEAQRIWRLVDPGYRPIDWQVDFKSGFRWSERTWYRDIRYGHAPGVDIKVPWELARMQHLPQVAWACALAAAGERGFAPREAYAREFRNQVLDFAATNPPRFGVNWCCTMDVAIRVANWLVAFDLFRAYGAEFDEAFATEFARSVHDHGRHIVAHLEWHPVVRSNHYLADVAGLLFAAAYLPRSPEVDAWLALAVQELVREVEYQFGADGAKSEASAAYHRLSAEMVVYGTALVLGLPQEKQAALADYDHRLHRVPLPLAPAPLPLYALPDARRTPFPPAYVERLERMAEFTAAITRPDGRVPQIGDNDSGRFLKLEPARRPTSVAEEDLDHRHVVAAIGGLYGRADLVAAAGGGRLEADLVRGLAGGAPLPARREPMATIPNGARPSLHAFSDFGLYVYRSARLYVAVRCGPVGQKANGAHAHNDQLSIEISVDGVPFVVDPGTYLYTPAPAERNRFRSTAMHSTLAVGGREQNGWPAGPAGLFTLADRAAARTIEATERRYVGEHLGFGEPHRRTLSVDGGTLRGLDECGAAGEKRLRFHLAPAVAVEGAPSDGRAELLRSGVRVAVWADAGKWSIVEAAYSPAYGVACRSRILEWRTRGPAIRWEIRATG